MLGHGGEGRLTQVWPGCRGQLVRRRAAVLVRGEWAARVDTALQRISPSCLVSYGWDRGRMTGQTRWGRSGTPCRIPGYSTTGLSAPRQQKNNRIQLSWSPIRRSKFINCQNETGNVCISNTLRYPVRVVQWMTHYLIGICTGFINAGVKLNLTQA